MKQETLTSYWLLDLVQSPVADCDNLNMRCSTLWLYQGSLPRTIRATLHEGAEGSTTVQGWLKSVRAHKNVSFLEISDGTSSTSLQAVLKGKLADVDGLVLGSSLKLQGDLKKSRGSQALELSVQKLEVTGSSSASYPIQKKYIPPDVLRDHAHLRFRTSKDGSVVRVRDCLMREWHDYFEDREYVHIHTPIMTSSDCEGAGEAFRITTDPPQSSSTSKHEPFFPSPAYLTVSSQLNLEAPTHALSRAYTLSPSFRAEPSATSRHLAEFYMLEAEVAFVEELGTLMDTVEEGVKRVIGNVLQGTGRRSERARSDLSAIARSLEEDKEELDGGIAGDRMEAFTSLMARPFARVSYTEAVEILARRHASVPFEFEPTWGASLQSEHEKYLAAEVYAGPVFVTDYPKQLKPFYMRQNRTEPGRETVACFDLLAPGIGELAGGSLREERLAHLVRAIDAAGMSRPAYEWYLDLRRYGTVKHGGWGMGFERFICWVTGVPNVRDVVAFPRWKGHCRY